MVSKQLLVLQRTLASGLLEPVRVVLVEHRPAALRESIVRGVTEEDVAEPEPVLAGEGGTVGANEVLADEAEQRVVDRLTRERGDGACVELRALDGRALEHVALDRIEAVEPRGEEH